MNLSHNIDLKHVYPKAEDYLLLNYSALCHINTSSALSSFILCVRMCGTDSACVDGLQREEAGRKRLFVYSLNKTERDGVCYACGLLFPLFLIQINQSPREVNRFLRKHGMVVRHGSLIKKMVCSAQCDGGFVL